MAVAGGVLVEAAPSSAASAFVFVAVVAVAVRVEIPRALPAAGAGSRQAGGAGADWLVGRQPASRFRRSRAGPGGPLPAGGGGGSVSVVDRRGRPTIEV